MTLGWKWPKLIQACLCVLSLFGWPCLASNTFEANSQNFATQLNRLSAGDVLLLRPGVYRKPLLLRNIKGSADSPIIIRGDVNNGGVVFKASDILQDWVSEGDGIYRHHLDVEPSLVFVNGRLLTQLGGTVFDGFPRRASSAYQSLHTKEGGIWPGRRNAESKRDLINESFIYDPDAKKLYIKTSEDVKTSVIEASVRSHGIFAENVRHLVIEDVSVQHANTSVSGRGGAFVVWGQDVRIRRVSAIWNDLIGVQVGGNNIEVADSVVSFNGQMGLSARGAFNKFIRVRAEKNNLRGFNKWWEAGGFKFIGDPGVGLIDSVVSECVAVGNKGDGIWVDWKGSRIEISRNVAAYNAGFGVHYEVSGRGLIQDNVVLGNYQRGIYLSTSENSIVRNNLVLGNGLEGIVAIFDRGRRDEKGYSFSGMSNQVSHNIVAYNGEGAITLAKESGAISDLNVFWGEGSASRFSIDFPSPFNRPVYGLAAWEVKSGQDRRSWWVNDRTPLEWKSYLDRRSTELEPIAALIRSSRSDVAGESVVKGSMWKSGAVEGLLSKVGPRHL